VEKLLSTTIQGANIPMLDDTSTVLATRRIADCRSLGTYTVLDPLNKNSYQKFQQYKGEKDQVWDATALLAKGCTIPGSYDLERKLKMDEKERAEFEKRVIVGTTFKLQHVDPIKLSTNFESAGLISNFDRVLAQIQGHLKRYDLEYLFFIDLVVPTRDGGGLELPASPTTVSLLANHAYKEIGEPAIMNYIRWLYFFKKYPSDDESRLV
jgi:hypothetical protein